MIDLATLGISIAMLAVYEFKASKTDKKIRSAIQQTKKLNAAKAHRKAA